MSSWCPETESNSRHEDFQLLEDGGIVVGVVSCCMVLSEFEEMSGCRVMLPFGDDHLKSFVLFRRNSKDVEIDTFDELLEKLKQLRDLLATDMEEGAWFWTGFQVVPWLVLTVRTTLE